MTKRVGGLRRKSRKKLRKNIREKGKLSLTRYFQKFKQGEKVYLKAEPAIQKGLYHARFHGKMGIIKSKQGFCYNVEIKDGGKKKNLLIHPIHLKKI
jgi:large subunit ribosomal protein L21e